VRATSPPPALTVAAAAIPPLAAALVPLVVPSAALAERWLRPIPGEVARSFSYDRAAPFERGAHRGADLAARPGTPVRSACAGTVVHAGRVPRHGRVVSVRCGARRVSYLPLASVSVRAGASVRTGARLGTVGAGHGGLHLGIRREADPFGYEDPIRLLAPSPRSRAPKPLPLSRHPRRTAPRPAAPSRRVMPRVTAPRVAAPRLPATRVAPPPTARGPVAPHSLPPFDAPRATPRFTTTLPTTSPLTPPARVAPWPVWAGLALLLAGAAGSGTVVVRRRRTRQETPTGAATATRPAS
jgi:hypothetical protein